MAIKKYDVDRLKQKYLIIDDSQAEEAISFVEELLELEIEDTKINHPNATRTIHELEEARRRVSNWYHEVNNEEETFEI